MFEEKHPKRYNLKKKKMWFENWHSSNGDLKLEDQKPNHGIKLSVKQSGHTNRTMKDEIKKKKRCKQFFFSN